MSPIRPPNLPTLTPSSVRTAPSGFASMLIHIFQEVEVFEVFDAEGVWLGAVQMPPRFTPTQISSEYAIGKWKDPDDVQHVRVYRLTRRH